ncbi:MAG: hypothetical protein N5P05_002162 [Chroococcopsis gigantea SAG 12.99]|jgi:hypothetical protein|nr:hypothetical protein [Chlorogloea purpurea SAG 13.99]MDV3000556.1 hypothetical protein [Chroococcopsis gigantea SAG 12.99]
MKSTDTNQASKKSNFHSSLAGCVVSALLFPFCLTLSAWLAFALGPMGCALPNRCSKSQENVKAIVSLMIFVGGGLGIPIITGIGMGKAVGKGVDIIERAKSTEDNE